MQVRSQAGLSTPATHTEQHNAGALQTAMQLSGWSAGPTLTKIRKLQTHRPTCSGPGEAKHLRNNGSLCRRCFPGGTVHRLAEQCHQVSRLQQSESQRP